MACQDHLDKVDRMQKKVIPFVDASMNDETAAFRLATDEE